LSKGFPDTGKLAEWSVLGGISAKNTCVSDAVSAQMESSTIAWDACGTPMIAAKTIGKTSVLVDTNLTRFYLVRPSESITPLQYLHRIVNFLSL
jgi:hypothetical protein